MELIPNDIRDALLATPIVSVSIPGVTSQDIDYIDFVR